MSKKTGLAIPLLKKTFIQQNHRAIFYLSWLLLGLIQSGYTELMDDEAYYWVYSRYLDWGYFDHPPMIALLVKTGYAVFQNELGVRLLPLLMNLFSLMIIEKLIVKKDPYLFYAICLSIAALQVSGFVAVPDTPLIFFTAAFFWCYKKFIGNFSITSTFLLAVITAMLLYSKYHVVLIIFFTLLSNLKLFTKYQAWLAGIIALLLFAPHLWWQYQHDWVSFRYHLFENNVEKYRAGFTFEYIGGEILFAGPLAGILLLPAAFLYKTRNLVERALYFNMAGIYLFFLLSSFRGSVEINWTAPVLVSLIVLSHQFLEEKQTPVATGGRKLLYRLLPVTLLLVLFVRVIMIADILPLKAIKERYHSWKGWPGAMRERTKGLPVVFSNSYQRASKYWFYSGQTTYSQNWYRERKNNYNFWPIEDSLLGTPVYFLDKYMLYRFPDSLKTPVGWIGYIYDSSLASFAKINISVSPGKITTKEGEEILLDCHFAIPDHYSSFIRSHSIMKDTIRVGIFNKYSWIKDFITPLTLKQINEERQIPLKISAGLPKGRYYLRFAINCGRNNATHNSDKIELLVE